MQTIRVTGSFLMVHAGAVRTPSGNGVLLPAPSRSGKTTLVTGLVRDGFGYLSEEAGVIDPVTTQLYPYPRPLNLRPRTRRLFPDLGDLGASPIGEWFVKPEEVRPGPICTDPCPITTVISHRFEAGASTCLESIGRAEALAALADNSMNTHHYGSRILPLLERVVTGARSYRLVWGDLDAAIAAVRKASQS